MTNRSPTNVIEANHAYTYQAPAEHELAPLVVDSPHSCPAMPEGSGCVAPQDALMTAVDAFVDELWGQSPAVGAQLLSAAFHRCFIDVNRNALDIDETMLATPWPTLTLATEKSRRGMGLVRRLALPGVPMYDHPVTVAEVQHRLRAFYMPYHERLDAAIERAHARFGQVWHINAHSMKSVGNAMNEDEGQPRPDVVVSDVDGRSADPAHTAWVARWWEQAGYRVSINDPYKGGEIVRRFGRPALGRHSIQIEINRRLYMDEVTFLKLPGFTALAADIGEFLQALRRHALARVVQPGSVRQHAL